MGALIKFLSRWAFVLVFLILESIALFLFVENSYYQRSHFINSTGAVVGGVYQTAERWRSYLRLRQENRVLLRQMDRELNGMEWAQMSRAPSLDTNNRFVFTSARVLRSSIGLQNNIITLDAGRSDGIQIRDAVITEEGIVGIVKEVSEHFSTVISILSSNIRINGKLDDSEYAGVLVWDGKDARKLRMIDLPSFVDVSRGDTVRTNSYSAIFPPEIPIAVVDTFEVLAGESMYEVQLRPLNDFRRLRNVVVVHDMLLEERINLEGASE